MKQFEGESKPHRYDIGIIASPSDRWVRLLQDLNSNFLEDSISQQREENLISKYVESTLKINTCLSASHLKLSISEILIDRDSSEITFRQKNSKIKYLVFNAKPTYQS
jgi:hypothetical protein